jgi:hypothetical protein
MTTQRDRLHISKIGALYFGAKNTCPLCAGVLVLARLHMYTLVPPYGACWCWLPWWTALGSSRPGNGCRPRTRSAPSRRMYRLPSTSSTRRPRRLASAGRAVQEASPSWTRLASPTVGRKRRPDVVGAPARGSRLRNPSCVGCQLLGAANLTDHRRLLNPHQPHPGHLHRYRRAPPSAPSPTYYSCLPPTGRVAARNFKLIERDCIPAQPYPWSPCWYIDGSIAPTTARRRCRCYAPWTARLRSETLQRSSVSILRLSRPPSLNPAAGG